MIFDYIETFYARQRYAGDPQASSRKLDRAGWTPALRPSTSTLTTARASAATEGSPEIPAPGQKLDTSEPSFIGISIGGAVNADLLPLYVESALDQRVAVAGGRCSRVVL